MTANVNLARAIRFRTLKARRLEQELKCVHDEIIRLAHELERQLIKPPSVVNGTDARLSAWTKLEKEQVSLETKIEELPLDGQTMSCLRNMYIDTVGQLICRTERDLMKGRNFGRKRLEEVRRLLAEIDMELGAHKAFT